MYDEKPHPWENCLLPTAVLVIIILILSVSCSPRVTERITTITKDTTIVQIRERIIHDTAYVEIPVIIERNVTKDDSSHLENRFAVSDAWIQDGLLHHSLLTKPQTIDVPVDIPVSDTTTTHEHFEQTDSSGTQYVEVEKKLTAWQRFRMNVGGYTLFALLLLVGIWIFKKYYLRR